MSANNATIEDVEQFWNDNPLFSGESKFQPGTKEFFEDHHQVYIDDVFAGKFPNDLLIPKINQGNVLDLGCGVGFWTIQLGKQLNGVQMYAGDLTENAIAITKKRLEIYGLKADVSKQNAERMTFDDGHFDHINCQGVIHHTPNTKATVNEMARVLKKGGTAYISVYYKNALLRNWKLLSPFGKVLNKFGSKFKGRGRENIFLETDVNNITRLYDGDKNPIGKSYSKKEFIELVSDNFHVEKSFLNFFPARALNFNIPKMFHRFLSRNFGFMIHLNLIKK